MAEVAVPLEQAGQSIAGRYTVEEVLGRGGMAAVYRVQDTKNGRRCALKRSWSRGGHRSHRRSALLEREYYTLAQLAHPRIIRVYDFGVDERGPYYTMELLDGADLGSLGRVPWREACALLRDIASSLAILHSRGLLHRDVSTRNVRCDSEGRAKLIDFGALCSIGVSREPIGTAPFVAPEVMQMQALDSRSDLYSLGALGYFLLTGRQAYPARRLNELRDVWRSAPPPPERLEPGIPPALNALVMHLLALDRGARPQSAAEIMKRLCTIAELPIDEDVEVSRAYLTTPTLVGRDVALIAVRKQMLSLARGDGGTLLIEGVAGSGRTRMLDACVLEGKLLGSLVVRASGGATVASDWSVARDLCRQLSELLPRETAKVGALSRDVLGYLIEALRKTDEVPLPERSLLIRELREFVLGLADGARLIAVVDDIERIDEPSLAWLAALAHKTLRRPLLLVLASDSESRHGSSASLRLIRSVATLLEIEHLQEEQTEALMRSVFGDVPNLKLVAGRVHEVSHGNARVSMELAQHVVNRGLARYEAGTWSLPPQLDARALPNTLAASLEARLALLSLDARALCDIACLAEGDAVTSADLAELTQGWAHERVFKALHELVAGRVLIADAEHYRFSHRGFATVVHDLMPAERKRAIHSRIADTLASVGNDALRRAHRLLEAGRDLDAIAVLSALDLRTRFAPTELLQRAVERAEHHDLPVRTVEDLRLGVAVAAVFALDVRAFKAFAAPALARLTQDSGLALYHQLGDLPESERLSQALSRTQQRYLETPEHLRAYSVSEAISKLARLGNAYSVVGIWMIDLDFIESFPSLEPLAALSPAISLVGWLLEAAKNWVRGSFHLSAALYERVLARLDQPDGAGLDPPQLNLFRRSCHALLGILRAPVGIVAAETNAQMLEHDRAFRPSTWRIRELFYFSQGNGEEAHRCMRRAELLQLQDGLEQQASAGTQVAQLICCVRGEDLLGLRNTLEPLAELIDHVPNMRPVLIFGQAAYRSIQGDYLGALELIEPALGLVQPGRNWCYQLIAAAHVRVLTGLGRVEEAIVRGRGYAEIMDREELNDGHGMRAELGLALAIGGRPEEGMATIRFLIGQYESRKFSGIALGAAYEAAARVSLALHDSQQFDEFAERCAREYKKGTSPVLRAKLARLIEEAHPPERGSPLPQLLHELVQETPAQGEYETIANRLRECLGRADRARCALTLLLQQAERSEGALYAVDGAEISLLSALPEQPDDALRQWVHGWLHVEVSLDAMSTAVTTEDPSDYPGEFSTTQEEPVAVGGGRANPVRYVAVDGTLFEAVMLFVDQDAGRRLVAVLALQMSGGPRTLPNKELLGEVARSLLSHRDVVGIMAGDFQQLRETPARS